MPDVEGEGEKSWGRATRVRPSYFPLDEGSLMMLITAIKLTLSLDG
jgi:hypothetical protein